MIMPLQSVFFALGDAMPEAWMALDREGRRLASNRRFTEMFGLLAGQLPDRLESLQKVIAGSFHEGEAFAKKWDALRKNAAQSFTDEWDLAHPTARTLEVISRPMRDGGQLILWRDVTERKNLQQALLQAEKMQALGLLAGGIAHDFNNLLTAVSGNVTLAIEQIGEGCPAGQIIPLLGAIAQAAQGGRDLVKKLMLHARSSIPKKEPFEVRGLVTDVRSLLKHSISPLILVEVNLPKNLWHALADRSSIQQVLLNLCVNAVDAMKHRKDGRLTIAGANHERMISRHAPQESPADFVSIEVSDNGTGISGDVLPHIFEPLFTTKPAGEGTGLGLANCREIVEGHGGWIECHSTPGAGTTFRFFLPRGTVVSPPKNDAPPARAESKQRGTERVLVVDDDLLVRNVSARLLGAAGYQVFSAEDGVAALEWLREPGHEVDVILLDLAMPRLSGVDTMREVRKMNPYQMVVLCSGSLSLSTPEAFLQTFGISPDATLSKPYEVVELTRVVRAVLDARREQGAGGAAPLCAA